MDRNARVRREEGKRVRCTSKMVWKRNTREGREADVGMKVVTDFALNFHWAPCKCSNSVEESELCPVFILDCLLSVHGVEVAWRYPPENNPNLMPNH